MKTWGWILVVLGALSAIGSYSAGNAPIGGIFWAAVGAYLIHRAQQKQREKEEKDKWNA